MVCVTCSCKCVGVVLIIHKHTAAGLFSDLTCCVQAVQLLCKDNYAASVEQILKFIPELSGALIQRLYDGKLDAQIKQNMFHLFNRIIRELTTPAGVLKEEGSEWHFWCHELLCCTLPC